MSRFVIVNGKVSNEDEVNLSHLFLENQQKITHKIWFGFGGIPLFSENIDILNEQLEMLHLPVPAFLKNKSELFRITKRMLNKNKFYRSGYINFKLFWNNKEYNYIINSQAFRTFDFPFSEKGILVNFSEVIKFNNKKLARSSVSNNVIWNIATQQNRKTTCENSIIFNEKDAVCECISSNLFLIRANELFTPSLNTGCFKGILREKVLKFAAQLKLKVTESTALKKEDIFEMDELFIAGEELGIQWILGIENKRYVHRYSELIHKKLNDYLKSKVN